MSVGNEVFAAGFIICAVSASVTYCVVKSLGQCEQSRCEEVSTLCCHVQRDLSQPARLVSVATPGVSLPDIEQALQQAVSYENDETYSSTESDSSDNNSDENNNESSTTASNNVEKLKKRFGG